MLVMIYQLTWLDPSSILLKAKNYKLPDSKKIYYVLITAIYFSTTYTNI